MGGMFGMEKRWEFAAAASEEAFVSAAVANFGYLGYAFAYAYERKTGVLHQFKQLTPLGLGATVAAAPDGADASAFWSPLHAIAIDHAADGLTVRAPGWSARVAFAPAAPFDAGWAIPGAGTHRTRKTMGQAATGELVVAGRAIPIAGLGLKDWSRGHLARETAWRWAAGAGTCRGRVVAWNLRTGFDDPTQAENAVWVDGAVVRPGPGVIEPGGTWRVAAGPLELAFTPDGTHREDLDLVAIGSRYTQPWGPFVGTWDGEPVEGYGVVEDHWARW